MQAALAAEGIHIPGTVSDLGACTFTIVGRNAGHARRIIESVIRDHSLTVRISKVSDPLVYEVYANGVKVREESYVIK